MITGSIYWMLCWSTIQQDGFRLNKRVIIPTSKLAAAHTLVEESQMGIISAYIADLKGRRIVSCS